MEKRRNAPWWRFPKLIKVEDEYGRQASEDSPGEKLQKRLDVQTSNLAYPNE
ncbi:MAG: hypothetical protein QXD10_10035 [Metallosphaera sp.]|uniref:hypothetical protein n=1 Tax=Metallosphaera sp. TaxID=2020860 RepID=UPI0031667EE5